MKSPLKREITIENLRLLVKKLKENGIIMVFVVGGEPTLHPQFPKIFRYLLDNFLFVCLSTNGIFSERVTEFLVKNSSARYVIQFNISTPSFIFNPKVRELVIQRIKQFLPISPVNISITDSFLNEESAKRIIDFLEPEVLKKLAVRIAIQAPIAGDKNVFTIDDFPRIGNNFYNIVQYLDERGPPNFLFANSGMVTPCMFTDSQRDYLTKRGILGGGFLTEYHCHPKNEPNWFMVNPALEVFHCYQRSTQDRYRIEKNTDISRIRARFGELYWEYQKEYVLDKCRSCPFYGLESGKCSGPCLAFRMNALSEKKQIPEITIGQAAYL